MIREKKFDAISGWVVLPLVLGLFFGGVWSVVELGGVMVAGGAALVLLSFVSSFGFMAIPPNQARVLLLFGNYKGTVRTPGFHWVNPFFRKSAISLRVRNFETGSAATPEERSVEGKVLRKAGRTSGRPSKVNDREGNPIEISAVVVWKVTDTAEALFEVDDYEHYVAVQSEAALRNLASRHPYDGDHSEVSLRGNTEEVCEQLRADIRDRLERAGVEVIEARISHLAYAPEIAAAMLQRQQAQAVVAARTKIVEGAVGMVQMALEHIAEDRIVELTDQQRAEMVSRLLVVLCSDRHTQPVIDAG